MKRAKEEEAQPTPDIVSKRQRRGASALGVDVVRQCQEICDTLKTFKLADGRLLCEPFLRIPSKKVMPEYYSLVSTPIDLMRIQQKVKMEEYVNIEQMSNDIRLLVENSKNFYKKNTQEYKDACDLLTLYNDVKSKLTENADNYSEASFGRSENSSPAPSNRSLRSSSPSRSTRSKETSPGRVSLSGADLTDSSILEQFLAAVLTVHDETGRRVCHAFVALPPKEDYPDYYRVIKNPLDLKIIAERLRSNQHYRNLKDLEHDLNAMCRNAHRYNEPGSLIYKDASFLKRFVTAKKAEFVDLGPQGIEKIKNPNATQLVDDLLCFSHPSGHHGGQLTNALEEDSEDEDTKFVPDDKFSALYTAVRYAKDEGADEGMDLIEPFLRLPSRSFYSDYYDEIRQPMSLFIINRKIKMDEYNNFEEMVSDVNLMFNNAKLYNVDGSVVYTNASKLQRICNQKVFQLDPSIDTSQFVLDISFELGGQDNDDSMSSTSSQTPAESTLATPGSAAPPPNKGDAAVDKKVGKLKLRVPYSSQALTVRGTPRQRPGRKSMDELMGRYRNKLNMLFKAIAECKDDSGRPVAAAFMEKPSRKLYPNYYDVIANPIDLTTIHSKIESDQYQTAAELASDVELMFKNAKLYNEEKSQIWSDVQLLEKEFKQAWRLMGPTSVESPRILKEKFGWYHVSSLSKNRDSAGNKLVLQKSNTALTESKSPQKSGGGTPRSKFSAGNVNNSDRSNFKKPGRARKQVMLYNAIKDYADAKGRVLSTIFMKLPSKQDYPDYYDVIKKPIDMQKIHGKIMSNNQYIDLDALVQDFVLMFDNACSYNDPESTIYKDALALQRVLLQKKAELLDDESSDKAPDVHAALQELMTNLFITVYNYQDPEGRCYSDSLAELPDLIRDKENAQPAARILFQRRPPFSLDDIKRNIDRFRYRRLDRFQQDVFEIFEKARFLTRSDSEIFEDSVELQTFFIKTRDQLCNFGKSYYSPALKFDQSKFDKIIHELKERKKLIEKCEDAAHACDPASAPSNKKEGDAELDFLEINGLKFNKNEFVYIKRLDDDKLEPHIMRISRIWRDASQNEIFVSGNWFYRPYETYHLATRKFLEKEVFRTDLFDTVDSERLIGKCFVMFVKDYLKFRPKIYPESDIYCCESKYLGRMKHSFQRLSTWPYEADKQTVELEERPSPLKPQRVASVFVGDKKDEFAASISPTPQISANSDAARNDQDYSLLDMNREEVVLKNPHSKTEPDLTYFEQINFGNNTWLKLGDAAYLSGGKPLPDIIRIQKIWCNASKEYFVSGSRFGRPYEVVKDQSRLCYKRELFATNPDQTVPLSELTGKCIVLSIDQYTTLRPVDIIEDHIYVCQYDASNVPITTENSEKAAISEAVADNFKIFEFTPVALSDKVLADEILYFKRPIAPQKVEVSWFQNKDNVNSLAPAVNLRSINSVSDPSDINIQKLAQTLPKLGARSKSGYILFSAVIRKKIMQENPSCPFGQISKLVGIEWKRLNEAEKKRYDEEAEKIASARAKLDEQNGGSKPVIPPGHVRVWFCKWRNCDYQFETAEQLSEHIMNFHTSQIIEGGENQFICLWQTCTKYKKDGKPFPSLPRLSRHMKEKHVQLSSSSKCILPQQRGKNFVPLALEKPQTPRMQFDPIQHRDSPQIYQQIQQQYHQIPPTLPQASNQQTTSSSLIPHQVLRFQTPPPQQMGPSTSLLIDNQGNVVSGTQQLNIYQIQQQQFGGMHQQRPTLQIEQPQIVYQPSIKDAPTHSQKQAEPVFVIPPQRVQRVLHSEAYLRYLESLNQPDPPALPTISRWDRYLSATAQNTKPPLHQNPPEHFFDSRSGLSNANNKEQLTETLWNLRNHLMSDNLQLYRFLNLSDM